MHWLLGIAIDLAVLSFLGWLYYFFQKKRILKSYKLNFNHRKEDFLLELHSTIENNNDNENENIKALNLFAQDVEKANSVTDLKSISTPSNLDQRLKELFLNLKE